MSVLLPPTTISRDQILDANPIDRYLDRIGVVTKGSGNEVRAGRCPDKEHSREDTVSINIDKGVWHCHGCDTSGSVIDWEMRRSGSDVATAMKTLSEGLTPSTYSPKPQTPSVPVDIPSKVVASYDYFDEMGRHLYAVLRFEPKTFRQRRRLPSGGYAWNLDGVRRVLYRLPEICDADTVIVCEGEKDADSINRLKLGAVGTCNPMGAGKWSDAYTESLTGKDVIVIPDNDEPGLAHAEKVLASVNGRAKTVRLLRVPTEYKDVSDWVVALGDKALDTMVEKIGSLRIWRPGGDVPIKLMGDLEREYSELARQSDRLSVDFSQWLPRLGSMIRPLVPGDLAMFVMNTSVGKTLTLQNIAASITAHVKLLFELELPGTQLFERWGQQVTNLDGKEIQAIYKRGDRVAWEQNRELAKIGIVDLAGLSTERMAEIIKNADVRLGLKPTLVMVDYMQLVAGQGRSRYERASHAAEGLKVLAKETNTVVIATSQVGRPDSDNPEVGLHDGKDSGSLENSAQLVIGGWRDAANPDNIILRVNKATKGGSGSMTTCRLLKPSLRIVEVTPYGKEISHTPQAQI